MRINYNVQAMNANLALNQADDRVSQSIARLSSGLKVAAAKDNPSGYAMSKRMNMQIEGLSRATQSSNDAISVINIADGALSEVSDMIQRINELATQASNGTMSDEDRSICQDEINQLKSEINRVASTTQFNGQVLMDGSFDLKGYVTNTLDVKVATYSDTVSSGKYTVNNIQLAYEKDAEGKYKTDTNGNYILDSEKVRSLNAASFKLKDEEGNEVKASVKSADGSLVTIEGENGFSITLSMETLMKSKAESTGGIDMDLTGLGPMDMQIGANEDQIISMRIPNLSLQLMGMDDIDVSTLDGASAALDDCKQGLEYINDMRSRLGAYQNRLDHTVSTLDVTSEAMTSAYSGLVDADMAEETVTYSTQQIISQAATSVLAQANDRPSQALQLLQ